MAKIKVKVFKFNPRICFDFEIEETINSFTSDIEVVDIQTHIVNDCYTERWGIIPCALVFVISYKENNNNLNGYDIPCEEEYVNMGKRLIGGK